MTHVRRKIVRVTDGCTEAREDWVSREQPVTIQVNGEQYITLLATAENLKELAVGFAFNEGLISSADDIAGVRVAEDHGSVEMEIASKVDTAMRLAKTRVMTTGCGKGSSYFRAIDSLTIKPVPRGIDMAYSTVNQLMIEFNKSASHKVEVGAVHASALARETMEVFREDVARHNSVDKLVGHIILNNKKGCDYALLTSGRITSELILKAVRIGISIVVSRSAPSELAARLGQQLGVTVVGFARGRKFNIYSHPCRITGRENTEADAILEDDK